MTATTIHSPKLALALLLALIPACTHAQSKIFFANDYGAKPDSTTVNTAAIQKAIDAAATANGTATLKPGTYLTGSLFLKSGTTLDVPEGVTLIGSQKLEDYPMLPTRIAGIDTADYSASHAAIHVDLTLGTGRGGDAGRCRRGHCRSP